MSQFHLNFHHFPIPKDVVPSEEELSGIMQQWQAFISGIAHQGKFLGTQRLAQSGSIIGGDGSVKEAVQEGHGLIVGTLTLEATDLDEAISLAKGCPVLAMGGSVEIRPIIPFSL